MAKKKGSKLSAGIDWLNHIFGLLSVVLGVLIAFWLNSWAQGKKEQRAVIVALQNIRNELEKNSERLDSTLYFHVELHQFLDQYLQHVNDDLKPVGSLKKIDSLMKVYPQYLKERSNILIETKIYQLSDVAWKTAINSGVMSSLDFELAYKLNYVYDLQEKIKSIDETILADLRGLVGRKEAFDNVRRSMVMSQALAGNLKSSNSYATSIQAIDQLIDSN